MTNATKNTVVVTVSGTGTSLTNYGTISQTNTSGGRAVRVTGTNISFTLTNEAGATISAAGDDAIQSQYDNSVIIYNSGTIEAENGGGQAIDLNKITTGTNEIYNYATGLIEAFGADAVRPGVDGYIYNAGTIESQNIASNGSPAMMASTRRATPASSSRTAASSKARGTASPAATPIRAPTAHIR